MRDDRPRPQPVKVKLDRVRLRPRFLQRVDGPHGEIRDEEEGDDLPAGFPADLIGSDAGPARRVQDEDGLARGLQKRGEGGGQDEDRVALDGELAADYGEGAVDEHAGLGADQEDVVELEVPAAVVF